MKKKILITDDDPGVQDVFKIIFEKAGYDVKIISEGRSIIENNFDKPDLFLLDKQLSGMDGLQICTYLKSQKSTRDIPVIMISATPGIGKMAREAGADDFVAKPFQLKDLLNVVAKWVK